MRKITLTLLLIAALSGCNKSTSQDAGQRSTAPLQKITFAYTVQPQGTLVHVAVAKGYFVEGLRHENVIS